MQVESDSATINRLFNWGADESLILHKVAKGAGLASHGGKEDVPALYMGEVESLCDYWVPLEDWKGEIVYIKARGVDYKARLPGCEDPVRWYSQFPQLVVA
jgi:hypothetical protein